MSDSIGTMEEQQLNENTSYTSPASKMTFQATAKGKQLLNYALIGQFLPRKYFMVLVKA